MIARNNSFFFQNLAFFVTYDANINQKLTNMKEGYFGGVSWIK